MSEILAGINYGKIKEALREDSSRSIFKIDKEFPRDTARRVYTHEFNVMAVKEFKGDLYVTLGTDKLEIWKKNGFTGEWTRVYNRPNWGSAALTASVIFNDMLYFGGLFDPPNQGGVIRTSDGATWEEIMWITGLTSNEVFDLEVYGGKLYATAGDGTIYESSDGSTWTLIYTVPGGRAGALITYPRDAPNRLYYISASWIMGDPDAAPTRIESFDGTTWTLETTISFLGQQGCKTLQRKYLQGTGTQEWLYFGASDGGLWRYDGTSWVKIAKLPHPITELLAVGDLLLIGCGYWWDRGQRTTAITTDRMATGVLYVADGLGYIAKVVEPLGLVMAAELFQAKVYLGLWGSERDYGQLLTFDVAVFSDLLLRPPEPRVQYFEGEDETIWRAASIDIGDRTFPIPCKGYSEKTLYFLSNTGGTLTVEVDIYGDGNWQTLKPATITADKLYVDLIEADAAYIRISFDTAATVTAWLSLRGVG